MKIINKILIVLIISICACGNRNQVIYNPIGDEYNTVITYLHNSGIQYFRKFSESGDISILYFEKCEIEKSGTTLKACYFTDDNICYRWTRSYPQKKLDIVVGWLNKNFENLPKQSMTWKDIKQDMTYSVYSEDGLISLVCTAQKADSNQINKKIYDSIPIIQTIPSEIAEKKLIEDKDRIDTIIVYSKTLSPSYSDFWCERINIIYHYDGWKVKVTCSKGAIYSPEHAFAIMEFSNMVTGQTFNVYNDSFTESSLQERQDFICDETITIHLKDNTYKHNSDFGLYIDAPFIFMDIDFCGEKELLVKTWRYIQRSANVYDIYKITNDGIEALKTPPFNQIDGYTTIDQKNKTIIIFFDGGYSSWKKEFYQRRGKKMELVRVEELDCNKFTIHMSSNKQEEIPQTIEELKEYTKSDEYKSTVNSARLVVKNFKELVSSKKYEEALDLYLSDKGSFNVAFEKSTEQYDFFQENIMPLIEHLKDRKEADLLIIESLEFHLFVAEGVISFSDWKVIPEHYEHLISSLGLS